MPPAWVSVSDEVSAMMARIRERLVELSALHARALLPNFDEFSGEDARVEVLTQEITRMFKRCEKNLTALAASKGSDQGDAKVRQNVVRSMAAELQKQSVDFRKKQKDYLQKLKQLQDRCVTLVALWCWLTRRLTLVLCRAGGLAATCSARSRALRAGGMLIMTRGSATSRCSAPTR